MLGWKLGAEKARATRPLLPAYATSPLVSKIWPFGNLATKWTSIHLQASTVLNLYIREFSRAAASRFNFSSPISHYSPVVHTTSH